MELDMNAVAHRLGMAILEKMAADYEVQRLRTENDGLRLALEEGERSGQDLQGEGHQGA